MKWIFYGVETMFCMFKPSLIFDGDFRYWLKLYLKSRDEKSVSDSTKGMADVFFYSFNHFD